MMSGDLVYVAWKNWRFYDAETQKSGKPRMSESSAPLQVIYPSIRVAAIRLDKILTSFCLYPRAN